jgi:hypothetical protein
MATSAIQILPPLASLSSRAEVVREEITGLKTNLMESSLKLGRLLKEARDNQFHLIWGYPQWGAWVEDASGLDMSERQSFYLISVVERSAALGIPDTDLHKVKMSKLKAIFSLPKDTDPDLVRSMVKDAEEATLKTVRDAVGIIKNVQYVFKTIKLEREVAENVWDPAMERARREYGNTIDYQGDLADITDSKCIEMIFADFNAGPSEEDKYDEEEIIEAQFEDILVPSEAA